MPVTAICRTVGVSDGQKASKGRQGPEDCSDWRPKGKKWTIATIRRVAAEIWRDPLKSIQKLAVEHNMAVNSMKRIIKKDLGMRSRVIQEKPIPIIDALPCTVLPTFLLHDVVVGQKAFQSTYGEVLG